MSKIAVVALGGNALLRGNQAGTIEEQEQNTTETLENLVYLIKEGYNLVISHGNGPQVGNILMRNDAGESMYGIPQMPLDICVADSQGGIGYMIERMLRNVLQKHGIDKEVCCLETPVIVNHDDPAFKNPTKRVGRSYNKKQADELASQKNWIFKEEIKDTGSGWRRVVPSPRPIGILNIKVINQLVRQGIIVIAAGGGGVPVYIDAEKNVRPTEAVIDKDLASSLMAAEIKADEFYILTDVPYVYINYKKPGEKKLEFINHADTVKYLNEGMFGEGNMAPKIRACLNFIENGGSKSVITESTKLEDKSYGTKITMEYED
ncbi:MAG: carbamate kinase [Bacteroidales bacterium]|nr:carbamate kinase [Bacteroidales bacterium]HPD95691.1 carbamate kinase [Tenuifilaceae bacterium]HRX32088.1 carbamate kinase [Tenuifilaceae bacterium]